jgi:hypothetical protein
MKILLLVSVLMVGRAVGQEDLRDRIWLESASSSYLFAARPAKPLCSVPVSKSPNVRGKWQLGMGEPDAIKLADGTPLRPVRDPELSTKATYFDGKLIQLRAVYHNGIAWDSAAEFAFVIAKEFDLPAAAWRDNAPLGLVMFCDGWTIMVEPNRVEIRDESAIARKIKSEAAAAEEKKKTFKP